ARVVRNAAARPEREHDTAFQPEEGDSAVLELRPDDSVRLQAETVPVESAGLVEVVHAERDHGDARFHSAALLRAAMRAARPGPGHRRVESKRESRWAKSETYESHGGITTSSAWASLRLSGSPWVRAMSKRRLAMPLSPVLIMVPSGPTVTLDWVPVVLADAW